MSLGYSVGDFIAVCQLAWSVYKSCKEAPESFANISVEVLSLHAVLKEVEELLADQPLSASKQNSLATITSGCQDVLRDLQALTKKYESLGSKSKRTWDRMRWGSSDIAELRQRLTSNTMLLTAFMSTIQIVVERKLDALIQEYQDGRRDASVISVATLESLTLDDKRMWREIRKELEGIGISVAAFDANKAFILEWFQKAVETGAFEEQGLVGNPNSASSGTDSRPSLRSPKELIDAVEGTVLGNGPESLNSALDQTFEAAHTIQQEEKTSIPEAAVAQVYTAGDMRALSTSLTKSKRARLYVSGTSNVTYSQSSELENYQRYADDLDDFPEPDDQSYYYQGGAIPSDGEQSVSHSNINTKPAPTSTRLPQINIPKIMSYMARLLKFKREERTSMLDQAMESTIQP
ncbi:hypothetical protein BDZ45DRAFT_727083 [Acephala macrosclerotiorum]|nr:hypothetical protein BDZ45DRAFT_727083 [Acephala macrosclerotiorum]